MSIEIKLSKKRIPYKKAMLFLKKRVEGVKNGDNRELIWILEHPKTYTAGVSYKKNEILDFLGENIGLGQQLTELKSQYAVLASKVSNDNQLVERIVDINQAMTDKISKALNSAKSIDQKGKLQLANLSHDNEILF